MNAYGFLFLVQFIMPVSHLYYSNFRKKSRKMQAKNIYLNCQDCSVIAYVFFSLTKINSMFAIQSKSTTATSTVPATSAGSLSGAISTTVEPLTTTPAASVGDDNDTNTWSQESPVPPTPSAQSTIDVSSHSTAADPLKSTETMTLPLDVHGKSRYNSGGSDDSNELTFTQEDYEPQMTSQLSSEQLNQLDIDEEPVIRASDAKIEEEQSQHVESTNDLSALSEPTHNAQVNPPTADNVLTPLTADNVPTDEENPFTAYPKPPVLSAAESDGETMLGATAAAAPFQQLVRQYKLYITVEPTSINITFLYVVIYE